MLDNKNFVIVTLIIACVYLSCQCYMMNQKNKDLKKQLQSLSIQKESIERVKFEVDKSISNLEKRGTIILPDFEVLDREFYHNLENCNKIELATRTALEYSIYGIKDNKCSFQKRSDFYVTECMLPLDINRKYAQEGIEISKELERLRTANKAGFVSAGDFIAETDNNSSYCKTYSTRKK